MLKNTFLPSPPRWDAAEVVYGVEESMEE